MVELVHIILVLLQLVLEVLEVVVMEAIQLIQFLQEQQTPVEVEEAGLVMLLLSKTLELEEELVVIDVLCRVKALVVVHRLNHHLL